MNEKPFAKSSRRSFCSEYSGGFTLVELLVAIAVISILVALLMPALGHAKAKSKQTVCLNNLAQIAKGVHLYAGDFGDILFAVSNPPPHSVLPAYYEWTAYVPLTRNYVGLKGSPSPDDTLFACPMDTFYYDRTGFGKGAHFEARFNFSSYAFNAGNAVFQDRSRPFPGMFPGIMGTKSTSIVHADKTVLVAEFPAFDAFSWHQPSAGHEQFNDAQNLISFVDGHVSYTKMYYGSNNPSQIRQQPLAFNPPPGYKYKWSGD